MQHCIDIASSQRNTLPETNILASENQWLENEFPFGMAPLPGCWLVTTRITAETCLGSGIH